MKSIKILRNRLSCQRIIRSSLILSLEAKLPVQRDAGGELQEENARTWAAWTLHAERERDETTKELIPLPGWYRLHKDINSQTAAAAENVRDVLWSAAASVETEKVEREAPEIDYSSRIAFLTTQKMHRRRAPKT